MLTLKTVALGAPASPQSITAHKWQIIRSFFCFSVQIRVVIPSTVAMSLRDLDDGKRYPGEAAGEQAKFR